MSNAVSVSVPFGPGPITMETGKLAKLADGAVLVTFGETVLMVTAVSGTSVKEGQDFFPLTVEYRERAAAAGKIPGGYFKREGRPSEKEILTCRMTDRPLRPLFPKGYFYDTQIITTLLSADGENEPDIMSMNGASAALMVSDIPFAGPVGAVRVGRVGGQFICNPTHSQRRDSDLDLVYVGSSDGVQMIEGSAERIGETEFKRALAFANEQVQIVLQMQRDLAAKVARPKRVVELQKVGDALLDLAFTVAGDRIEGAIYQPDKVSRKRAVDGLKKEVGEKIRAAFPAATSYEVGAAFDSMEKRAFRRSVLDQGRRCDGRGARDVRPLSAEVGLLPRTHGSALFTRGETQALCLATLASEKEAQELDTYTGGSGTKRFMLHYAFPPFSVGETGRVGGVSRRETGHGALAERSLVAVLPPPGTFPYAIRVTSDIMESNGSSSMASICGGCLALMDAGVPLTDTVAGISVGLVTEFGADGRLERYLTLTDIIGTEDHYGDMDFKLAGTRDGITGFQLDLKLPGISLELMSEAIDQARTARLAILDFMQGVLPGARQEMSVHAPRVESMRINPERIGMLIGPGGKTIRAIIADTGAEISVEDDGTVKLYSSSSESVANARRAIESLFAEIELGKTYTGKVVAIKDFGAFVECIPGKDGLVHISEWDTQRVNRMEDVVKVGDEVTVKCVDVDDRGRAKLSRRVLLMPPPGV